MFSHRLYYFFKPLIPWSVRFALRRLSINRRLAASAGKWPINKAAGCPPKDWRGWPQGKRFAFVLTHDVEGSPGLSRVESLVRLEQEIGFRSSFNLIPEGDYRVPSELRNNLTKAGFEVGVHDLRHDGKLFSSKWDFDRQAQRINGYLKDWNAVGFRSGFMLRNLSWLGELDIKYDASTFDTDPFEPQPDGAETVFPFWVPREGSSSEYLELPYTLTQDSTLFLLLREKTIDIWKQKLDWLAECGGMALLDTHPDYMNFGGPQKPSEYSVQLYREFLEYVKTNYAGQYWHALPREVFEFCQSENVRKTISIAKDPIGTRDKSLSQPQREPAMQEQLTVVSPAQSELQGKRAAVVLFSYYPNDPRPRREAEAMARAGASIQLICLREKVSELKRETINGVQVTRVPLSRRRAGKLTYAFQYIYFTALSFCILAFRGMGRRYDLIHVHNMPDFLVFSALVPRLLGAKVILDLHDPMPELYMSIYELPKEGFIVRLLKWLEKLSIGFSHLVLTPNIAFQEIFTSRTNSAGKVQIIMNSPKSSIFDPELVKKVPRAPEDEGCFTIFYHGSLVERHGLDMAVRAVSRLHKTMPDIRFHIFGSSTPYMDEVLTLIKSLGMEKIVVYHGWNPLEKIAAAILNADLGIIPNRRNPFTEINMPTRIFEYLSMGKPVIAPGTKGIRDYFNDRQVILFDGSESDLEAKIAWAYNNRPELAAMVERGRKVYNEHRWEMEEAKLLSLTAGLFRRS